MNTSSQITTQDIIQQVIEAWKQLKAQSPLVHCMTNSVASNYVANILLAAGASPAMIDNPFEAESFARIAGAISLNTGTPTSEQTAAMKIAAKTCAELNKPWVLDPVGYGSILQWRSETVDELVAFKPTIIRGNASEISALAGKQVESKGVDSTANSADVYHEAKSLLEYTDCIAISGASDFIISKELNAIIEVHGGSHLQPRITATGCALGALIAAYCVVSTPTIATIAAHIHFAIAGKLAYQHSQTVGSFNVSFLDQIDLISAEMILQYAEISIIS